MTKLLLSSISEGVIKRREYESFAMKSLGRLYGPFSLVSINDDVSLVDQTMGLGLAEGKDLPTPESREETAEKVDDASQ